MDIASTISGAITGVKQLLTIKDIARDAEASLLIADLQVKLAEAKVQAAELIEENRQLKEELARATSTVPEVEFKDKFYYKPNGEGPFCPNCYDDQRKLIRVAEMPNTFRALGRWRCGTCKSHYK